MEDNPVRDQVVDAASPLLDAVERVHSRFGGREWPPSQQNPNGEYEYPRGSD